MQNTIEDPEELEERTRTVENLRLNLRDGQQCVRDFFVCLKENMLSWPDVYSLFCFEITNSTTCSNCNYRNESKTTQIFVEMSVPPANSNLNNYVEDHLNETTRVSYHCEDGCKEFTSGDHQTAITSCDETQYIIVLLTRAIETFDGYRLVTNSVLSTKDISLR